MTAEIAVMNKFGVALAADSAVTISGGNNSPKVYNSVNKLFSLSKHHPVGIMVYGSAQLNGTPWELLIKEFRDDLNNKSMPTIKDYANSFFNFIRSNKKLITPESRNLGVFVSTQRLISILRGEFLDELEGNECDDITLNDARKIIHKITDIHIETIGKENFRRGLNNSSIAAFIKKHGEIIDDAIDHVFEKFPLTKTINSKLKRLVALYFSKEVMLNQHSGVVFSGFGDNEYYPSLSGFKLDTLYGDKLKYVDDRDVEITAEYSASINAFAQRNDVITFMDGMHPDMVTIISGLLDEHNKQLSESIAKTVSSSDEDTTKTNREVLKLGRSLIKNFFDKLEHYKYNYHSLPVIDAVSYLPKDELAAMAESLVNLTSFRHRMSLGVETVGGPIDVAVISRGDGFIWIRRKHYFDPKLNHHFFENYFK